jgi:hypothetical protein
MNETCNWTEIGAVLFAFLIWEWQMDGKSERRCLDYTHNSAVLEAAAGKGVLFIVLSCYFHRLYQKCFCMDFNLGVSN